MKSTKTGVASPWLVPLQSPAKADLRLYCFSYAGAGARVYGSWSHQLPQNVEIWGIELPGRGARYGEVPATSIQVYADAIASELGGVASGMHFAFFGHSMGALLSFEVARRMEQMGAAKPAHLLVSGAGAPHLQPLTEPIYALPDQEFAAKIREYDGTPPELFAEPELMELVLPILRADFQACDTYLYEEGRPLGLPITAFGGLGDPETTLERLEAWQHHTTREVCVHQFEGGHFFIQSAEAKFLELLNDELRTLL